MDRRTSLLIRPRRTNRTSNSSPTYLIDLEFGDGRRITTTDEVQLHLPPPETSDPDAISRYGQELFSRLFPGRLATSFNTTRLIAIQQQQPLRLRLAIDPQDAILQAIPWELLYLPALDAQSRPQPLATSDQVLFSRYIDSEQFPLGDPLEHRPIRMLIVLSEPSDLNRWGLATFDRKATEQDFKLRFRPFQDTGQLELEVLPVASESALRNALERGSHLSERERGFDVVLYIGHALFAPQYGTRLLLEDGSQRRGRLFDGGEFARLITQLPSTHKPTLIALVACNSATVDLHAPLSNLAARLIAESGVPAVIAMQRLVAIDLARDFTQHLTEMLLRSGLIDLAVTTARRRIYRADTLGWSTPVLYTRLSNGRLFQSSTLLSYVEWVLSQAEITRWAGDEYIDLDCITIPPGQTWQLFQYRPENSPKPISARDTILSLVSNTSTSIAPSQQLVLLTGSHQSGQTTILRRICHDLARQAQRDINAPVGVFVSLAGYEQARGDIRLYDHIIERVRQQHVEFAKTLELLFRGTTSGANSRPRCVFLLDDVDQIAESHWKDLIHDLNTVRNRLTDQRFVVAAPQAFTSLAFEQPVTILAIQPLDEPGIVAYLRQRYRRQARNIIDRIRENRLLHLASDPRMLILIVNRLAGLNQQPIVYHNIIEEFLTQELRVLDHRYQMGDVARASLYQIAWYMHWHMRDALTIGEVFTLLAEVRHNRDYNLEELFYQLGQTRLISMIGQREIYFTNQAVAAYCTAQALCRAPDRSSKLDDIVALCADVERQRWWEEALYALANLLDQPEELLSRIAKSLRNGNQRLAVIAARCLEALPPNKLQSVPLTLRNELIDNCLLHLDERREPSAERRELLVKALGKIDHPQIRQYLRQILVDKVRQTSSGPRYEYSNVRIAAARALRDLYLPDFRRLQKQKEESFDRTRITLKQLRDDRPLIELMHHWLKGEAMRQQLRDCIITSPLAPERAVAAFALADVSISPIQQACDARFLLRIITHPLDTSTTTISSEWMDTMWSAADALTLFDPEYVTPLIAALIRHKRSMPNPAAQQLAYLVGRLRIDQPFIIDWLIHLLINNPSQNVKARALQSLAWIGEGATNRSITIAEGERNNKLTIKQLIEEIALWQVPLPRFVEGEFTLEMSAASLSPIYLRRKAIEALAWIGDRNTLRELDSKCQYWPLELRTQWYISRESIQQRIR
ncbi:CHAT domain-containing protein [Chloroflexus aggregans]|uniref:Heat repeat-containing PBS lyase n=1 Tax=Chloroflexus aggregans (strain MD-66 / DSM 9485) TaxID=326427 RepID=B8G8X7_CHLAD|nr:CHAT domain-containing protein [Chloroflexus aggregans]ACL26252.1 heat repeat-containing PBS lyase [Chloroflexus aggregans DSM 9485]